MKQRLTNYIVGYFFVLAFLLSGVIPDILIVSGQLSNKAATETVAEQEAMNAERGAEEVKGALRVECFTDHPFFTIYSPQSSLLAEHIIPFDIAYTQAVYLTVPTPPPNARIASSLV
jgi:hypothetical protein